MALQICLVWPGAMPSGSVPSSHGARSITQAQSYEADQGNVYHPGSSLAWDIECSEACLCSSVNEVVWATW